MGFAIPITSAKEIIEDLIAYSYVPNRPMLGITYYPVSASAQYNMIAQIKGLPAGTLIINEISSSSSLANTQAQQYDMIIAVDGKELTKSDILPLSFSSLLYFLFLPLDINNPHSVDLILLFFRCLLYGDYCLLRISVLEVVVDC